MAKKSQGTVLGGTGGDGESVDEAVERLLRERKIGAGEAAGVYEELLRERARVDLGAYNEYVYGWKAARHHKIWAQEIMKPGNNMLAFIAPPGCAKTSVCGVGACGWEIGRDKEIRIGYIGNTPTQANKQSNAVKETIERSERYGRVFPGVRPDYKLGWGESEWYVERDIVTKDATMIAAGVGGSAIQGSRFDLECWDDVCDPENMATSAQREKLLYWLEQIGLSRFKGSKNPRLRAFLTRYHAEDVVKLLEKIKGMKIIHMPALGYWELVESKSAAQREDETEKMMAGMGLKYRKKAIMDGDGEGGVRKELVLPTPERVYAHRKVLHEGGALWPESESREKMLEIRERNPLVFERTYQGFPNQPAGNLFKREWWGYYQLKAVDWSRVVCVMQSWDTAFTEGESSDYSVGLTALVLNTGHVFVVDRRKGKWLQPDLEREVANYYQVWKPNVVLIEDRGGGKTLMQGLQATTMIPIQPVKNRFRGDRADKSGMSSAKARLAASVSGLVRTGRVLLAAGESWVDDFVEVMAEFPGGAHDDDVDAFTQLLSFLLGVSMENLRELLTGEQMFLPDGERTDLLSTSMVPADTLSLGPEGSDGAWISF